MAGFAMSREFKAARAQQNIRALTIKWLASRIAMQRLRLGAMCVSMAVHTTRRWEKLLDRDQLAVNRARVRGAEMPDRRGQQRTWAILLARHSAPRTEASAHEQCHAEQFCDAASHSVFLTPACRQTDQ